MYADLKPQIHAEKRRNQRRSAKVIRENQREKEKQKIIARR